MYDETVKALRVCEEGQHCDRCPKWDDKQNGGMNACQTALLKEAADAIEELSKPRWIPVSERLPERGVPTLICGDGNVVEQGFFDDEYGYWYDWGGNRTFAHHWMPLPEPPEEAET